MGVDPRNYGLPAPNHKLFEAHPTQSVELPLRLGSGDVIPKPNMSGLDGDTVYFTDDTSDQFDVIVYANGYNITFPFFDEDFISAPGNQIRLYKRTFKPGYSDIAYAIGRYALPAPQEMERVIDADQRRYTGHCTDSARHAQQVDIFYYEHDLRTRELPAGVKRAMVPA
jgi:hypothetical protein